MAKEREQQILNQIEILKGEISSKGMSVQQRINEVIERKLTSGTKSTEVLDVLLQGLSKQESQQLLGGLVLAHWNNVKDDPEVFLRGTTLYKAAMMHPFKGKMNDKTIERYLKNPNGYLQNMRVPTELKNALKIIVDDQIAAGRPMTQLAHNIVFAMVLGPVGDYQNKQIVNLQSQRYNAEAQVKTAKGDERSKLEEKIIVLQDQEKTLKEKYTQVLAANNKFTDVNRMLSQKSSVQTATEKSPGAPNRIEEVAKQVHDKKGGINSEDIVDYIKIQDNLLSSISGNYQKDLISKQTESVRQVFDAVTTRPRREAVIMDKAQLQVALDKMQSNKMISGWVRERATNKEMNPSEAQKEKPMIGRKTKAAEVENESPSLPRKIEEFKDADKEVKGLEAKSANMKLEKQLLAERKEAMFKRFGKDKGVDEAATPKIQRRGKGTEMDEAETPKMSRRKISPRAH